MITYTFADNNIFANLRNTEYCSQLFRLLDKYRFLSLHRVAVWQHSREYDQQVFG